MTYFKKLASEIELVGSLIEEQLDEATINLFTDVQSMLESVNDIAETSDEDFSEIITELKEAADDVFSAHNSLRDTYVGGYNLDLMNSSNERAQKLKDMSIVQKIVYLVKKLFEIIKSFIGKLLSTTVLRPVRHIFGKKSLDEIGSVKEKIEKQEKMLEELKKAQKDSIVKITDMNKDSARMQGYISGIQDKMLSTQKGGAA